MSEDQDQARENQAGETPEQATGASAKRRRTGLIALTAAALLAGAAGSWVYNHGYKTRSADNSAVVRAAADSSTYVTAGDYTKLNVPIRNDSPYPFTVVGLTLPTAPRIVWDGARTVVQPGATAHLRVTTPSDCAATPHPLKQRISVRLVLRVVTASGKSHGGLKVSTVGVIQYAADYCAVATPADS
jgi:hypothetical protein